MPKKAFQVQVTIRALAKVDDAYKLDTSVCRTFRPHGAIAYDDRILSYALSDASVSIWTLDGRQTIPFVCGARQRALLATQKGETDLAYIRGEWYLFAVCDIEEPLPMLPLRSIAPHAAAPDVQHPTGAGAPSFAAS